MEILFLLAGILGGSGLFVSSHVDNPSMLELPLWMYNSIVIYIFLIISALTPTAAIIMGFIIDGLSGWLGLGLVVVGIFLTQLVIPNAIKKLIVLMSPIIAPFILTTIWNW